MPEVKIKFNLETEDVEFVVGDKVVDSVGTDVVQSWITAYNEKHGFVKPETVEVQTNETKETENGEQNSSEES